MSLARAVGFALLAIPLAACGGVTDARGGSPGTSESGGTGNGAAGGGGSNGGGGFESAGGAPGVGGCCFAMAMCDGSDVTIGGPAACPPGANCYSRSVCCSTVWCAPPVTRCEAIPACDPGDQQIDGACPPTPSCYERTACGATINCLHMTVDAGAAVDGGPACPMDLDHHYVGMSPGGCAVIDYGCPSGSTGFSNPCGCGCVQPASCPDSVGCMPGLPGDPATNDPLCTDSTKCPYTVRAL